MFLVFEMLHIKPVCLSELSPVITFLNITLLDERRPTTTLASETLASQHIILKKGTFADNAES